MTNSTTSYLCNFPPYIKNIPFILFQFSDGFCYSIENTFQIVKFTSVLNLDDDYFILIVFSFDIYMVEFIIGYLLITFTFEYLDDFHQVAL